MLVARPMSVEPSSSSTAPSCDELGGCDRVGSAVTAACATVAPEGEEDDEAGLEVDDAARSGAAPMEVWGRDAGEVSFRGRRTI